MTLEGDVKEELKTKITTQTFAEAGGVEAFPDLDIGGMVTSNLDGTFHRSHAMRRLNNHLDRIANHEGYTHIFGVVYERDDSEPTGPYIHIATGTGYKPKE